MSDLEDHILPIYVIPTVDPPAEVWQIRFAGTGFVAYPNVFVTCWHCVSESLEDGQMYAAVRVDHGTVHPLSLVSQEPGGADLATALIGISTWPPYHLGKTAPPGPGLTVGTIGYPGTTFEARSDGIRRFDEQGRYFQGYITRVFNNKLPSGLTVPSYEIDMPAPRGLSGSPIIATEPPCKGQVIGVTYGAHPPFGITSEAGEIPLPPYIFALAHYYETLMALRGPVTSNRSLRQISEGVPPPN